MTEITCINTPTTPTGTAWEPETNQYKISQHTTPEEFEKQPDETAVAYWKSVKAVI